MLNFDLMDTVAGKLLGVIVKLILYNQ